MHEIRAYGGGTRNDRGFTLIELLVVVVIAVILSALLLPTINGAVATSRAAACSTQMRQLGVMINLYAADHEGELPINYTVGSEVTWDDALSPYDGRNLTAAQVSANRLRWPSVSRRASEVYRCPAEKLADMFDASVLLRSYTMPRVGASTGNQGVFRDSAFLSGWEGRLASLPEPTKTILLCELRANTKPLGGLTSIIVDAPLVPTRAAVQQDKNWTSPLHRQKWNYLMADGRVALLGESDTVGTGTLGVPRGMWTRVAGD